MEIVAPAGSESGLRAAVLAGAGAVYLGLPFFGARAKAQNFQLEDLKQNIDFAHAFGTRVFITMNTLIKDSELDKAVELAEFAYDCGADAIIVQDIRFIERLKQKLPKMPLHASTQIGVHNAQGAKTLMDMGVRRVVLARETLPEDIRKIKETGVEIEFFVQGALCVSFSGNCYFSSLASSYSGNRGKCMQLCRKQYVFNNSKGYHLSAKDICLYSKLNELQNLGVDAIKIEGRMRSEEYVSQAVTVYKSGMPTKQAIDTLKDVFNRGNYCSAYIDDNSQFNIIYSKMQSNMGLFVGKISDKRQNTLLVKGYNPSIGDGYKILYKGKEVGGACEKNGNIVSDCKFKIGDELYRTYNGALKQQIKERELTQLLPIDVFVNAVAGNVPTVKISYNNEVVEVSGENCVDFAINKSITVDDVIKSFNKVAEFPFKPTIRVNVSENAFLPISTLNTLRRNAYLAMYEAIVKRNTPDRILQSPYKFNYNQFKGQGTMIMVDCDHISKEVESLIDYIVVNPKDYTNFSIPKTQKPVLLNLPITMRGNDIKIIEKAINRSEICAVISNNVYTFNLTDKPILLGTGHNVIGNCKFSHIRSYESDDVSGDNNFVYVYGNAPVMTLCHCPYGKCINCNGNDVLIDENGRNFTMRRYKVDHCYWQILNCVPHNLMVNRKTDYRNKFYDCTGLSSNEILQVLNDKFTNDFTRGNINKGLK